MSMKKILCGILFAVLLFSMTAIAGCLPEIEPFTAGTYETYEMEGEPFIKAKLIIQPITQEEYESADGINVIKNESKSKENNVYYSFELFFYDENQEDYAQAKISNLHQPDGWHYKTYSGEIECSAESSLLKTDFIFVYNSKDWMFISYVIENDEQWQEQYLRMSLT